MFKILTSILLIFTFVPLLSCMKLRNSLSPSLDVNGSENDIDRNFLTVLESMSDSYPGEGRLNCNILTATVGESANTCRDAKTTLYANILNWAHGKRDICRANRGKYTYVGKTNPIGTQCKFENNEYSFIQTLTIECMNALSCSGWQEVSGPFLAVPCAPHGGSPYPWEGSGMCTGNWMTITPLAATGLELAKNSTDQMGNYGFGRNGFRLSVDSRILRENDDLILTSGYGTPTPFIKKDSIWVSKYKQLSRSTIELKDAATLVEKNVGATFTYKSAGGGNSFALTKIEDRNGNTTSFVRDTKNQITSIETSLSPLKINIHYGSTAAMYLRNVQGETYTFSYDGGRLTRVTDMFGKAWGMGYATSNSTEVTSLTDPFGAISHFVYLPGGLISKTVNPYNYVDTYTYSAQTATVNGFTLNAKETFQAGKITTREVNSTIENFEFDSLGLLKSYKDDLARNYLFEYDSDSRLAWAKDPFQVETTIKREAEGKITTTVKGLKSSYTTLAYVDENELLKSFSVGPLNAVLARDSHGNLLSYSENNLTLTSASYDPATGRNTSVSDATGNSVSVGYDANSFVSSLSDGASTSTFTNNALGLPTEIKSSTMRYIYDYDSLGRTISASSRGPNGFPLTTESTYETTPRLSAKNSRVKKKSVWAEMGGTLGTVQTPTGQAPIDTLQQTIAGPTGDTRKQTETRIEENGVPVWECGICISQ